MILDIILLVVIVLILAGTSVNWRSIEQMYNDIRDDIGVLLSKISPVFFTTILIGSLILLMSVFIALGVHI